MIYLALALCAVPWLVWLGSRHGAMLATLLLVGATPALLLLVFLIGPSLQLDLTAATLGSGGLLAALGIGLVVRDRARIRIPARSTALRWGAAALGGVAWLGTLLGAAAVPGADRVSWAMNGDAANNIHLARALIDDHGYIAGSANAVPLPHVALVLAMLPARDGLDGSALLSHDLGALATTWALATAATGLLLGLVASELVRHRPAVATVAAATGSLLVTTWLVSGLPLESGYLNVHVALPLVLATWLAFLQARSRPVLAAVLLLVIGLGLLAVWTPLAALTVCLLLVILHRNRLTARTAGGANAVAVILALAPYVAWLLLVAGPLLRQMQGSFTAPGHGFPFTGWLLLLCAAVAVAAALVLRPRLSSLPLSGVVAIAIAAAGGVIVLVALSRNPVPWESYYPAKFVWIVAVLLLAIALSLLARLLAERAGAVGVAVLGAAVLVAASTGPEPARAVSVVEPPLVRILAGDVWNDGDATLMEILAYADRDGSTILWQSGLADEAIVNFWLIEFDAGEEGRGGVLRGFAFTGYREFRDTGAYTPPEISQLCTVIEALPGDALIVTANPERKDELADACPEATPTFEIRR